MVVLCTSFGLTTPEVPKRARPTHRCPACAPRLTVLHIWQWKIRLKPRPNRRYKPLGAWLLQHLVDLLVSGGARKPTESHAESAADLATLSRRMRADRVARPPRALPWRNNA